ncbi:hypothetical protein Ancab_003644 [Ancistrocladus abbreviatus]
MATAAAEPTTALAPINAHTKTSKTRPRRTTSCLFSFAAYAKTVIDHLNSCNIHITDGLSEAEFSDIESTLAFSFPPDLRSILSEGLPVGPGFPNWRASSPRQLHLLTSLPILELSKEVSRDNFWIQSWGPRPDDDDEALRLAKELLREAPVLVPIFRYCYIPSRPCLAGNPIFYVHGGDVRLLSNDVGGFFQEVEFWKKDWVVRPAGLAEMSNVDAPVWAAKAARSIEFWSEVAEGRAGVKRRRWWSGELGGCLEDVMWRLRDGGWREEEVREMMIMDGDCCSGNQKRGGGGDGCLSDREGVLRHVRTLSRELLKGGWSIDDVVYSLGDEDGEIESGILEGESWVDLDYEKCKRHLIVSPSPSSKDLATS